MTRQRIRIRFRKEGDLRLISHRDLARAWERWFRRAGVKLRVSEGFNPRPRINLPSALAVGVVGIDEVLETDVEEERTSEQWQNLLEPHAPPGLIINSVQVLPARGPAARVTRMVFEVPLSSSDRVGMEERIGQLLARAELLVSREDSRQTRDVRPFIENLRLENDGLRMNFCVTDRGTARPREVLDLLGLENLEHRGVILTRTHVEVEP